MNRRAPGRGFQFGRAPPQRAEERAPEPRVQLGGRPFRRTGAPVLGQIRSIVGKNAQSGKKIL